MQSILKFEPKDFWDYENELTPLQLALRDNFLKSAPMVNVFGTLTFNTEFGVSYSQAKKIFGKFIRLLKAYLYGEKSKKRIFILPVVEKSGIENGGGEYVKYDGTHIHFVAYIPNGATATQEIIRVLWMASSKLAGDPNVYCPDSNEWYQPLFNYEAKISTIQYTIKTCRINTNTVLWDFVQPFTT